MDETMQSIIELETEAEHLLLARHQLVENDRVRNGNREALTSLRKIARTTKTSVPSPFESIMKEIVGPESRPLVKEVRPTCGNHDSNERTWMMFPGTDVFARIPLHAAHTVLESGFFLCNDLGAQPTVSKNNLTSILECYEGKGAFDFRKRCPCGQGLSGCDEAFGNPDRQTKVSCARCIDIQLHCNLTSTPNQG